MNKFVVSESKLLSRIISYKNRDVIPIIDYAVEHNKKKYVFEETYKRILSENPNSYHAIKLSGADLCPGVTHRLVDHAKQNCCKLLIDAENVDVQHKINSLTNQAILGDNDHVSKTYQMYRKDALDTLCKDMNFFYLMGKKLNIKLVRGAYLHQDKHSGILHTDKSSVDKDYNFAIELIMENKDKLGEVIFATHNKKSFEMVKNIDEKQFYHASLMGFDKKFLNKGHIQKMVYIPFGPFQETFLYLARRLYENPFILNQY